MSEASGGKGKWKSYSCHCLFVTFDSGEFKFSDIFSATKKNKIKKAFIKNVGKTKEIRSNEAGNLIPRHDSRNENQH